MIFVRSLFDEGTASYNVMAMAFLPLYEIFFLLAPAAEGDKRATAKHIAIHRLCGVLTSTTDPMMSVAASKVRSVIGSWARK